MDIPDNVQHFYHLSLEYCQWAENSPSQDEDEIFKALYLVSGLYQQALTLQDVEPSDEDHEDINITKIDSKPIYKRFSSIPFQYYSEVFHPISEPPDEPCTGDIADDLMDIYIDLKEGIMLYEKGAPIDAVFQWRTTFGFHWGRHATSALRVLHIYGTELSKE